MAKLRGNSIPDVVWPIGESRPLAGSIRNAAMLLWPRFEA
jgi:hypothetical protein